MECARRALALYFLEGECADDCSCDTKKVDFTGDTG